MKTCNCVRKVDELGRVTLPLELREIIGIGEKDSLEIYTEGDIICMKPVKEMCSCCKEQKDNLQRIGNVVLCNECMEKIVGVAGM